MSDMRRVVVEKSPVCLYWHLHLQYTFSGTYSDASMFYELAEIAFSVSNFSCKNEINFDLIGT